MSHNKYSEYDLFFIISTLNTKEECHDFLSEMLSPNELKALKNRWKMMWLLNHGNTQRDICEQLGVAISSVSRANRVLKTEPSFCKKLINKKI